MVGPLLEDAAELAAAELPAELAAAARPCMPYPAGNAHAAAATTVARTRRRECVRINGSSFIARMAFVPVWEPEVLLRGAYTFRASEESVTKDVIYAGISFPNNTQL